MVLGSLSLIFWTLIIVTTIKYVGLAMRVDNHGEGGIMALMALLTGRKVLGSGRTKKRALDPRPWACLVRRSSTETE